MNIAPDLADRLYTIMVQTIGTPDIDYRRWSFIFAMTELKVKRYVLDSRLGPGALFVNEDAPIITCAKTQVTPIRERLTQRVNVLITEIAQPKPAKVVRKVRVKADRSAVAIPVQGLTTSPDIAP